MLSNKNLSRNDKNTHQPNLITLLMGYGQGRNGLGCKRREKNTFRNTMQVDLRMFFATQKEKYFG